MYQSQNGTLFVMSCNHGPIFCMLACHSSIAQVEYQGQTRYARNIDSKSFIHTCYGIGHRLELSYFHFAQFSLNEHQAELRTLNLGQIFKIKLWTVGQ